MAGHGGNAAIHRVLSETGGAARVDNATVKPVVSLKPKDVVPATELRDSAGMPLRMASGGSGRPRAVLFTAVWCETYLKDTEPDTVGRAAPYPAPLSRNRCI